MVPAPPLGPTLTPNLMTKRLLFLSLALSLSACGDDPPASGDSGSDAAVDLDQGVDSDPGDAPDGSDVPDDLDVGPVDADTEPDAEPDAEPDLPADVEPDAIEDADGADVPTDSEPDVPDAAPDAEPPPLSCGAVDATALDGAVAIEFDLEPVPQDDGIFDLGIQSGAARATTALLWTHIADGFPKTLVIWRESEVDGSVLLVQEHDITPGPVGFTHVPVEGLAPCTWYNYAFVVGDRVDGITARSAIGQFKTAHPPGSLDIVRIGATSCTSFSYAPYTSLERTAEHDIDLFVHLGDQSYNDDDESLSEYRESWRRTLNDPGYRAIYPRTSMLATWDDHEVTNNWNPESISSGRRDAAFQAYFETLAVERQDTGPLWHSYRWGDTVEFFVTDNRAERLPSTRSGDDAQYISDAQMEWLQDGLIESEAHFKVIFSSVPITNMPNVWDLSPEDRWEGYAAQRSELLDFITGNEIEDVYFLGGDFHIGFVAHVEPSGPANRIWEIAVGPGANGPNPLALALTEPQFDFRTDAFGTEFVTILEFDPLASSVRVLFTDTGGTVLYDEELR